MDTSPRACVLGVAVTAARFPFAPFTACWPSVTAAANASPIAVPPYDGKY